MWRLHAFTSRLYGLFTPRADRDFEQELKGHLAFLVARFEKQGIKPEEARYAARRQLGNLAQIKERQRESRSIPLLETILRDLHFGLRQLRTGPAFSVIAISVLALGIGANTAIFSVVNRVLLRPLPFDHPERLVALFEKDVIDNNDPFNTVAPANFLDWRKQTTTLEQIAAISLTSFNLSGASKQFSPERVDGCGSSANLFQTLGIALALGRGFLTEEDRPGGTPLPLSATASGSAGSADRPMCCQSALGWMEKCMPLSA